MSRESTRDRTQDPRPKRYDPLAPIGIFDSGVGGLSVARAIRQALPNEGLLFVADQANIPYGEKSLEEVRCLSEGIARALIGRGAKLIVVACNTASAAALKPLRARHPDMNFVGMEPAVKPAAEHSATKVVGVLATSATFQGELFASVVERFAQGVEVIQQACPGLVERIEAGDLQSPRTEQMLRGWLEPMLDRGIDALALACTHYPFVSPLIERICGPRVRVIDPAPAIARQVERLLGEKGLAAGQGSSGGSHAITTGDPQRFRAFASKVGVQVDHIGTATWRGPELLLA